MTLTTKSKRFNEAVLNGHGMYINGYWVDWHDLYEVRRIDGGFEFFMYKDTFHSQRVLHVTAVSYYADEHIKQLLDDMRCIAPLSRWWYVPESRRVERIYTIEPLR